MAKSDKKIKEALNRPKEIDEILNEQIDAAMRQHTRGRQDLFLSAISAGLDIGFSVFTMAVIYSLFQAHLNASYLHFLIALAYPVGFVFVVIGKSELFTEHTTLAVIPVLNRNASVRSLLVLWGIIYAGNLIGGFVFGFLLKFLPHDLIFIDKGTLHDLAMKLIHFDWHTILFSGLLAGWLMGLLSWLVASSQDTVSRIFIVGLITFVIGLGGLHHSIVGSIEVFAGWITSQEITWKDYLHVQFWSTIGNIIGGVVFVALIKFSHVNPRKKKLFD